MKYRWYIENITVSVTNDDGRSLIMKVYEGDDEHVRDLNTVLAEMCA